jgi:hypothetical protein
MKLKEFYSLIWLFVLRFELKLFNVNVKKIEKCSEYLNKIIFEFEKKKKILNLDLENYTPSGKEKFTLLKFKVNEEKLYEKYSLQNKKKYFNYVVSIFSKFLLYKKGYNAN